MSGEKVHSKLGASSCERWSNCPGSVALCDTLPKPRPGKAAQEGTAAHNWCEYLLKEGARDAREYIGTRIDARLDNNEMTKEQAEAINVYLAHVYEQADKPGAVLHVEHKFHLSEIDAELFGTNDACVYVPSERTLYVIDYKHGVGVTVDVEDNKQLRYYAYGAWQLFRGDGIDTITVSIVQPRGFGAPIKVDSFSTLDLVDWSFDLAEWAAATRKPDAPLNPGAWCNKTFCPARHGNCPALKAAADAALIEGFEPVKAGTISADELGRRFLELPKLKAYVKGIEEAANAAAAQGNMPAGLKYVLGRGSRDWYPDKSADEIAKEISRVSNACNPWKPRELISPAQAEKALGKKVFSPLEKELVKKYDGKPTLAPLSDERPAWQGSNAAGFEPIEEIEE